MDKLKKEFFIPKTTSKFIKEEKKEIEINNESEVGSVSEKSFKKKKNDKINLKNIIDRTKSIDIKMPKDNLPLIKKSKSTIEIIYNKKETEEELINNINNINNKKKGKNNLNNKNNNNNNNSNNKININRYTPSGSNFNLINLEVGVSLREENKYKSGGNDFYSKYKKYSIFNFNKLLKEALELNAIKSNTKYESPSIYDLNLNDINSKFLSKTNNNKFKNIFLSQENSSITLNNFSKNYKPNISTNNSSLKLNNNFDNKTLTYTKSTSNITESLEKYETHKPMIILSHGSTSLNDIFTPIDNNINKGNKKKLLKMKNIFRKSRNIKSLKSILTLKDINNFNKEILTNKNFELYNKKIFSPLFPNKKPEKPLMSEIYKEIGFNKTISRNRNKISLKKPLAITTLDFFK